MVYDDKFEQKFDVGIVGWWYFDIFGVMQSIRVKGVFSLND